MLSKLSLQSRKKFQTAWKNLLNNSVFNWNCESLKQDKEASNV